MPTQSHSAPKPRLTPLLYALVAAFASAPVAADSNRSSAPMVAQFDVETLKQRGIDPKLAEYFREAPKFPQGRRVVSLILNGVKLGKVDALFDGQGQLCVDDTLISKAKLRPLGDKYLADNKKDGDRCYILAAAYPQATVTLRPNREEIFIVVPQEALLGDVPQASDFNSGGTAAMLNYDVMTMRSNFNDQSRDALSVSTETGFNMGNWIVRSRQLYTKDNDTTNFEHLYAYAQRTFAEQKAVLQVGQLNINSPLFAGAPINGVQVLSEQALLNSSRGGALVEGIAQSQATVEVRQAGALIFTTMVPEGPFALTNIPLLNSNNNLDVTVRESNGAERHFVVPAASFRSAVAAQPGYSFSLGKIRTLGNVDQKDPFVATGAGTWQVRENATLTAGAMAAQDYQSVGLGIDASLARNTSVNFRNILSRAPEEGATGVQASVSINSQLTENLTASVSATQQNLGFRDLSDVTASSDSDWFNSRYKSQYSASLGWNDSTLGSFNVSYMPSRTFDGQSTNRLMGSWGKTFKHATVSASFETALGGSANQGGNSNAFYLNVSIPFGSRNVRSYVSRYGDSQRAGVAMSDVVNEQFNYRIAAERSGSNGNNTNYASGNVSMMPRYTTLDLGYAQSDNSQTYSGRISGGVVAHGGGITLSPYPVQDTFGVIDVGDISGVKIATPYGPVWTDFSGQAVIPQLSAYRESRIEVQTQSLPRRVDLKNGFQVVGAGRGSVSEVKFEAIRSRRMLVTAVDSAGQPLPKGSSVTDGNKQFLTMVLDKGTLFLQDADPDQVFKVSLPDEKTCTLKIDFPKETDDEAFYDLAQGVCHAS